MHKLVCAFVVLMQQSGFLALRPIFFYYLKLNFQAANYQEFSQFAKLYILVDFFPGFTLPLATAAIEWL